MSTGRHLPAMIRASLASIARLPARARQGRPARIILRLAATAAVWLTAGCCIPGTPAGIAIQAAAALWWLDTTRTDLAPPQTTPRHPRGDASISHPSRRTP